MKHSHRIWLAVPPEEKDDAVKAHPRLDNGQSAIAWNKEHGLWYARPGTDLTPLERWLPQPQNFSMASDDPVAEFAQVLENAGLALKGLPVMDGSLQRVPTNADKNGTKSGVYRGYLDGRPAGWFRDYRSAESGVTNWTYSGGQDADPRAKLHLRAQAQQNREDSARALEQQYNTQADYATHYVTSLPQAVENDYLTRKGVNAAPGVRINPQQDLVVPFSNGEGQIRSYQRIPLTGGKDARILKNSEKTGNWFAFGTPENGKPVLFAEGYSTAASIHEATGLPVLMTVDAGNMIAVGQNARQQWPDSPFVFCADNDHHLRNPQTGAPENKGILSAVKAAELSQGSVIAPAFSTEEMAKGLTDFNDRDTATGRQVLEQALRTRLTTMGIAVLQEAGTHASHTAPDGLIFTPLERTIMDNNLPDFEPEQPAPVTAEPLEPSPVNAPESITLNADNATFAEESASPFNIDDHLDFDREYEEQKTYINFDVDDPLTPPHSAASVAAMPGDPVTREPDAAPTAPEQPASPEVSQATTAAPESPATGEPAAPSAAQTSTLNADNATFAEESAPPFNIDDHLDFDMEYEEQEPYINFDVLLSTPPTADAEPEETVALNIEPEQPAVTTAQPQPSAETTSPSQEPDSIVYGPRRPDSTQSPGREDVEQILKDLKWETQSDNTVLYRVDGQDAFSDSGNRLEMCDGASQSDRKVLAALAVAAKFYGGVIELTGSDAFKEKAIKLIVDYDLDIRMKLPDQRAQLNALRQQHATSQDAVVSHMPTPDLNRTTPAAQTTTAENPAPTASAEGPEKAPVPPPAPATPDAERPIPGPVPAAEKPETNGISLAPAVTEEPAPASLKPGQSVTAVLVNHGEAVYENGDKRGGSYFIELKNRAGSHVYWGQGLKDLVQKHTTGDVVTLTLDSRDAWTKPGEDKERVKNNWSLVAATTGMAVPHTQPERGQQLQAFPVDTFGKITQQVRQAWPEHMTELKMPPRFEDRHFYLREDRHPVLSPHSDATITPPGKSEPVALMPVMAAMNSQTQQLDLLLVRSAGEHLQGVVRLNNTLYPALATPTADHQQLVINAVTDSGPRYAGYGQAINFEPDGTTRTAPQLMSFQLKGQENDDPVHARLYTPEKQDDTLFQQLGFDQNWKQWDDSRKQEGRQEQHHHQAHSHAPGQ